MMTMDAHYDEINKALEKKDPHLVGRLASEFLNRLENGEKPSEKKEPLDAVWIMDKGRVHSLLRGLAKINKILAAQK